MRKLRNFKPKECIICFEEYIPTTGKQYACSKCAKIYWRKKHSEQARNRSRLRKLEAIEYLGGQCLDCHQEFHPSVYEFHHLNPDEKDSDGSEFLQKKKETMFKELNKCVLLCANCHRLRHHFWKEE